MYLIEVDYHNAFQEGKISVCLSLQPVNLRDPEEFVPKQNISN